MQFASICTAHFCYTSFLSVGQLLAAAHTSLEGRLWSTCRALRMHQETSGEHRLSTHGTAQLLVPPWAHQALGPGWQDSSTSYSSVFKPWPLILRALCESSEHSLQKVELKQQLLVLDSLVRTEFTLGTAQLLSPGQWTVSLGSRPFPHDIFL